MIFLKCFLICHPKTHMEICATCRCRLMNYGVEECGKYFDAAYYKCIMCSKVTANLGRTFKFSDEDRLMYLKAAPIPCDFNWRQSTALCFFAHAASTDEDVLFLLGSMRRLIRYKEATDNLNLTNSYSNYQMVCIILMKLQNREVLLEWRDEDGNTFLHLLLFFYGGQLRGGQPVFSKAVADFILKK